MFVFRNVSQYDNDFVLLKQVTTGLDISSDSTWVAAGSMGSPAVFNLKNLAELPKIDVNDPQSKVLGFGLDSCVLR